MKIYCYIGLLLIWSNSYADTNWIKQRWQFQAAYQALQANELETFKQKAAALKNYPIAHYLDYFALATTLDTAQPATLETFFNQQTDSPIAKTLRRNWLKQLAKKKDWATFLKFYTPQTSTTLRCHYLTARLETQGDLQDQVEEVKALWLVGRSQPKACDPAFAYLYDNKLLTDASYWQRIQLAMRAGRPKLARYLTQFLSDSTRQTWANRWQQMHAKPATMLKAFRYPDEPIAREIALYGLKRLVRKKADLANQQWQALQKSYAFSAQEQAEWHRYLALKGAEQAHPQATQWLAAVQDKTDTVVNQARLQLALSQQDWQAVIAHMASLPTKENEKDKWQYWQARALERSGKVKTAATLFEKLAQKRSYYGFLAADRLGKPYHFQAKTLQIEPHSRQVLLKEPAILRARELYFVGLADYARAEWKIVLETLTTDALRTATVLAHEWGWHDRAIVTAAKVAAFDALEIRFPLPFYDTVLGQAERHNLTPAWIYAVIRQESLFQVDARSSAGALGLMQLMPATAREVAAQQKIKLKDKEAVLTSETNIHLGSAYLSYLLKRFDANHLLAAAAYNAGPSRAKRWAAQHACVPADVWVELIPFTQTRDYVQHVMSYFPVFEFRLTGHEQINSMPFKAISTKSCES